MAADPNNFTYAVPMDRSNLADVVDIENLVSPAPWNLNVFSDCLTAGYECWILPGKPCRGFIVFAVSSNEAHLLNIAVHPNYQQRGLGRYLLRLGIELAQDKNAQKMFLEVRPSNSLARQLYSSEGFKFLSCRKNYYGSPKKEDALVLMNDLSQIK